MNAVGSLAAGVGRGVVKLFTPVVKGAVGASALGAPVWLLYNPSPDPVYNTFIKVRMYTALIGAGACAGAFRVVVDGAQSLIGRAMHIQNRPDTTHPPLTLFTTAAIGVITVGALAWDLCSTRFIGEDPGERCNDVLGIAMFEGILIAGALSISYRLFAAVTESAGGTIRSSYQQVQESAAIAKEHLFGLRHRTCNRFIGAEEII